jgi:stearoyl-CoA desaturase (delta-9 desaturase)
MPEFGSWGTDWWKPVLFVVVAGHFTNICVTLFLHRAQTHRGVDFHWLVEMPMRVWLWLTTAIRTKNGWHVIGSITPSPIAKETRIAPWSTGCATSCSKAPSTIGKPCVSPACSRSYGKGTPEDWMERHLLDKRSSIGIVFMLAIDIWLFGFFIGPIVWGIQMIWIPFWAAGVINGIGHALGYRNHDVKDESRNISPIGIIIGGEELHNNHHADPHSAKFAHRWFEFDIGWMYIKLLSFVGLAEVKYAREGAHIRVAGVTAWPISLARVADRPAKDLNARRFQVPLARASSGRSARIAGRSGSNSKPCSSTTTASM